MSLFKLGLTGSIATGKSTALTSFATLGYPTFSADEAVHQLYSTEAVHPIARLYPGAISHGEVDRQKLSDIIQKNPDTLVQLNRIVHPLVQQKIKSFILKQSALDEKLVIIDIPLLFETNQEGDFDAVALTWCSEKIQKQRALSRPEMNVEKLKLILAQQMSQSEKKQRADFLIDTNASIAHTHEQVASIAQECLARATSMQ